MGWIGWMLVCGGGITLISILVTLALLWLAPEYDENERPVNPEIKPLPFTHDPEIAKIFAEMARDVRQAKNPTKPKREV